MRGLLPTKATQIYSRFLIDYREAYGAATICRGTKKGTARPYLCLLGQLETEDSSRSSPGFEGSTMREVRKDAAAAPALRPYVSFRECMWGPKRHLFSAY